ncbi:hypothetical protein HRG84_24160 [Flavisolibacter sp. BT320]|nr:hypothetical protein [Flavisolibacter longurius]
MTQFSEILSAQKDKSPLPILYEAGYTPEKIKEEIISTFSPFFRDHQSLQKHSINWLVSDWINFMRISIQYSGIVDDITKVVDTYNRAKNINQKATIETLSELMELHLDAGNRFWSILKLEVPKGNLPLPEFVQTSMTDISNVVEGLSKSLFIEQVLINRIVRNKVSTISQVKQLKLGNLIDELITNTPYPEIFYTQPEQIKLSDWRNIAAHHTFRIDRQIIVCEYGTGNNKKQFQLTRDELFGRVRQCARTLEVLNMAHKIFGFDNMEEISSKTVDTGQVARDEIKFLIFSSGLTSQGFEIESIEYEASDEAVLVIKDMTDDDLTKRAIHSSQFLHNLWILTQKPKLIVKYKRRNGEHYLTSSCDGDICEEIADGKKSFESLAEKVTFKLNNIG